jgi:hypothetical protein
MVAPGVGRAIASLPQELGNMSSIRKATVMSPRVETESSPTESSPFEHPTNELLTQAVESADLAEIVRKLSKSSWFCEVEEA